MAVLKNRHYVLRSNAVTARRVAGQHHFVPDADTRQTMPNLAAWCASRYKHTPRHTIEEEHVRYLGDLKRTLKSML